MVRKKTKKQKKHHAIFLALAVGQTVMSATETWEAMIMLALEKTPVPKKVFWLHDLKRFEGWQAFVKLLIKEHGALCFTHKTSTEVANVYDGQRIVVFCLEGCNDTDNLKPVMRKIWELKRGLNFCTTRGVHEFSPPHVLVFANFAMPENRKNQCRAQCKTAGKDKAA